MSAFRRGQTLKSLFKGWWNEYPEIVASHVLSTIGLVGILGIHFYCEENQFIAQTFDKPLFLRPDDPRAKKTITYYEDGWEKKLEGLFCCRRRSACQDNVPVRVRRGAHAGHVLGGNSDVDNNGILGPISTNPSPPSTSSQEESCKPSPRNCYRLVILGSARVGKTSIVARFLSNKFEESYTPTIEDFHRKLYRIKGEVYQLDILDTSGNHPFPAMRRLSFLTGDLFVVVFSMDSPETFEEATRLREAIIETKKSAIQGSGKNKLTSSLKVPMVIAGNKCDRDIKKVTVEEAQQYCGNQDDCCIFVEVSAKRNYHVDDLFYHLFIVAGLPLEMAPNHHRRVPLNFGSPTMLPPSQPKHKTTLSIKRRLSDACGVVAPVRRPSLRTDLMIMRTKTCSTGAENNIPGSRITLWSVDSKKMCCIQ